MPVTAYAFYHSPLGRLRLVGQGRVLVALDFVEEVSLDPDPSWVTNERFLEGALCQLDEYFRGLRRVFDLNIRPRGTSFQLEVWQALRRIPYGQTRSYSFLAAEVGHPRAARAVGNANGRNPLPIILPCHRVIAADGGLGGYSSGLEKKRFLLGLEKS